MVWTRNFRASNLVAVAKVTSQEVSHLEELLADHFVTYYGAPSKELAIP